MTDAREISLQAAKRVFDDIMLRESRLETADNQRPAREVVDTMVEDVIEAYERSMLEAGFKMCPREATEKMDIAWHNSDPSDDQVRADWAAMWDAAP